MPEIIIVSDAVKGTKVDLDGKGHQVKRMKEIPKKWRQPKGADRTEMRKEEIEVHFAKWIGPEHRKEVPENIQRHV